ncbi:DUF2644 domain-containing protein, partial [Bifidobacterium longum]
MYRLRGSGSRISSIQFMSIVCSLVLFVVAVRRQRPCVVSMPSS